MKKPRVSVIMSVYNTNKRWLKESICSILNQTFTDFEFIIVLDCPTDGCEKTVEELAKKDERMILIRNGLNIGLTRSLNKALEISQGDYIARMDADDVSLPDRFKEQINFLDLHPTAAAVGSKAFSFGDQIYVQGYSYFKSEQFRIKMLFWNYGLIHSSAMIRKRILDEYDITYDDQIKKSQDYKLWIDLMWFGDVITLDQIQILYRTGKTQISTASAGKQMEYANQVALIQAKRLYKNINSDEEKFHLSMRLNAYVYNNDVKGLARYCDRLLEENRKKNIYRQDELLKEISFIWCQKAIRRMINCKMDMIINRRFLNIFRPSVDYEFVKWTLEKIKNRMLLKKCKKIYKNYL